MQAFHGLRQPTFASLYNLLDRLKGDLQLLIICPGSILPKLTTNTCSHLIGGENFLMFFFYISHDTLPPSKTADIDYFEKSGVPQTARLRNHECKSSSCG